MGTVMKVNIASVLKSDGASMEIKGKAELGKFDFSGSVLEFKEPVTVSGTVRNIGGTVEIAADVKGEYTTQCSRCNKVFAKPLSAKLNESFDVEFSDVDEECLSLNGNVLDMSGAVDACIFENIPLSFLCSDDCKGLCPVCGTDLNVSECNCDTTVYDPRFAIFRKLSKEV